MKIRFVAAFVFVGIVFCGVSSVRADTISWMSSGQIGFLLDPPQNNVWPGLQVGTPYSLTFSFDSEATGQQIGPVGCNQYAIGPATLTLGGFTYSNSAGKAYTNLQATAIGCTHDVLGDVGITTFLFPQGQWVQEPGAWNLNSSLVTADYYDLLTNGSLPTAPMLDPNPGPYAGYFKAEAPSTDGRSQFVASFQPTAVVPEPATMTLLGAGVAALLARRRQWL